MNNIKYKHEQEQNFSNVMNLISSHEFDLAIKLLPKLDQSSLRLVKGFLEMELEQQ